MDIKSFLSDQVISLPKLKYEDSFPNYLKNQFSKYIVLVDKISFPAFLDYLNPHKDNLSKICAALLNTIDTYYQGFPFKAYKIFEDNMQHMTSYFFQKQEVV
ncbi:hypothetical protein BH10BAC2_BH10BAC2_20600 [soil metagenome]